MSDPRTWSSTYEVTHKAIAAYCAAIGEQDPLFVDIAPPMFAAVFSLPAVERMLADDRFADDRARLLHAAQTFVWTDVAVVAGDRITTEAAVDAVEQRGPHRFYTFATRSWRPDGEEVARGEWLTVARAGA